MFHPHLRTFWEIWLNLISLWFPFFPCSMDNSNPKWSSGPATFSLLTSWHSDIFSPNIWSAVYSNLEAQLLPLVLTTVIRASGQGQGHERGFWCTLIFSYQNINRSFYIQILYFTTLQLFCPSSLRFWAFIQFSSNVPLLPLTFPWYKR